MNWWILKVLFLGFSFYSSYAAAEKMNASYSVPVLVALIPFLFFTFSLPPIFARTVRGKKARYLKESIWKITILDIVSFLHLIFASTLVGAIGTVAKFGWPLEFPEIFSAAAGLGGLLGVYTYLNRVKTGTDHNL